VLDKTVTSILQKKFRTIEHTLNALHVKQKGKCERKCSLSCRTYIANVRETNP